jgi:outer membrane immunogenic protein
MKKLLLSATALVALTVAASAADLPSRAAPAPFIAAVPVFTWTGFYVGVNAGYGWNTNSNNNGFFNPATGTFFSGGGGGNDGGFTGGGQVGYNYQIGQFVIGVETDIQYADLGNGNSGAFVDPTTGAVFGGGGNNNGNYFGTVRARAGFAFDRALIYATGGFAYGDIGRGNNNGCFFGTSFAGCGSNSNTNTGWTLGGGVEYAFTNNLTARVEGLYVNLDSNSNNDFFSGVGNNSNKGEFGVVRAGLNYKFSTY